MISALDPLRTHLIIEQNSEQYIAEESEIKANMELTPVSRLREITLSDGSMYKGPIRDGMPDGHGTLIFSSSDLRKQYTGAFVNGVISGNGEMIWKDDSTYDGEWKNGEFEGKGRYTYTCRGHPAFKEGVFKKGQLSEGTEMVYNERGYPHVEEYVSGEPVGCSVCCAIL